MKAIGIFIVCAVVLAASIALFLLGSGLEKAESSARSDRSLPTDGRGTAPADSASHRLSAQVTLTAEKGTKSKASWTEFEERFRAGDYKWIVTNAKSAPQAGSYSFAIQALAACADLLSKGTEQRQASALERAAAGSPAKDARIRALHALFLSCDGLGDLQSLVAQRSALSKEIKLAGDAREAMLTEVNEVLADRRIPREQRQERVIQLLNLDDPEAARALIGPLTSRGATMRGAQIPAEDLGLYRTAWSMAICSSYGACGGNNSREGHLECAMNGDCQYLTTLQKVEQMTPPFMYPRVYDFYLQIQNSLSQRNFGAFGVP